MWQPNKIPLSRKMLAAIYHDEKLSRLSERLDLLQSKNTPISHNLPDGRRSLLYDKGYSSDVYLVQIHIRYIENLIIDAYNRQS